VELCVGADEGHQVGAFTARQRAWAASMSLNAMASPAARDPGPLVVLVRWRTVAKMLSMVGGAQVLPVLGGVVVERHPGCLPPHASSGWGEAPLEPVVQVLTHRRLRTPPCRISRLAGTPPLGRSSQAVLHLDAPA
jgi:hypothetical protein